ncbi:MAG: DUF4215 domain-containing protein [Polyangia bacterium]|mgnify:CR=1 FL=1|nr:DUF4215 domain-containing protein [Polyangia bacterium]
MTSPSSLRFSLAGALAGALLLVGAGCGDDEPDLCGNGVVDKGEQCDDGNRISGDGCSEGCLRESFCGNSLVERGEECDDGNNRGGDGCNSMCQLEVGCGNGILEYGEACDDDNLVSGDGCSATCEDEDGTATCGNGILEAGEGCDDGNAVGQDGCSAECQAESGCGDGVQDPGEECDDGNRTSGDGCSYRCRLEFLCGDDLCDTEHAESCEKCPQDCCPFCGDGVLDSYSGDPPQYEDEECDDGNNVSGDGCTAGCKDEDGQATCGNGILERPEECDDGNTAPGDACSATCFWEFICGDSHCDAANGENCRLCPGDCCPDCGNNMIEIGERCDGNALGGKTCTDFCYTGGNLGCTSWCDYDLSSCIGTGPICGNGVAECDEQCDGADLKNKTCEGIGYSGGTLSCTSSCRFDVSSCGTLLWYFSDGFENPISMTGWTLGGAWQRGTPSATGEPTAPHGGQYVIGTVIGGNYNGGNQYLTDLASSPPIDLTTAIAPAARFYFWVNTESGWDCGNLWVNSGSGWTAVPGSLVSVPYNENEGGYDCWGGTTNLSWQQVDVNLAAYAGQIVRIGFGFYSDTSVSYLGFYIDDLLVAEPAAMP